MKTYRKNAVSAGVLFIVGTVGSMLSIPFIASIKDSQGNLLIISANENQLLIGALFLFISAASCVGVAISLYPVLRRYNEGLALGSVAFRIIEGALGFIGIIGLILLLTLSQEFVKAGAPDSSYFQIIGLTIIHVRDWVRDVPYLLTWCIGAFMYYCIFFQSKLISRWLSIWGLIAIILTASASMLVMFRLISPMSTLQVILNIPILLQEMVLAAWLIVKGFNSSSIASLLGKQV